MWARSSSDAMIDVRRSVQLVSRRCGWDVVCKAHPMSESEGWEVGVKDWACSLLHRAIDVCTSGWAHPRDLALSSSFQPRKALLWVHVAISRAFLGQGVRS